MNIDVIIENVVPYFNVVRSFLNTVGGFIIPIASIFGLSLTIGIAFYILHRL